MSEVPLPLPLLWADIDLETIIKIGFVVIFVFGSALVKIASTIFKTVAQVPRDPAARGPEAQGQIRDLMRRLGMELEVPPDAGQPVQDQDQGQLAEQAEWVEADWVEEPAEVIHADVAPAGPPRRPVPVPPARPERLDPRGDPFPPRQSVSQHVRKHIDTSALKAEVEGLGVELVPADERLAKHPHDVFAQNLGRFSRRPGGAGPASDPITDTAHLTTAEPDLSVAYRIRMLLSHPDSLRDAFILSEILQRRS